MCYEGLEYNLKDISKPINKSNIARYIKINTKNNQKLGWYYFLTGNLSAPRDILINNLFSEDFLGYGWEDLELGYRLYKKGIQLRYLKSAVNYHYHSYGFYEELERKEKMGFEAAIFIKKHPELKNWLGFYPLLMFIYKMLKNNGVSIKLLNSLSKKKGIGRAAKYVLSEYYYRHGYYLCQKFGQRKKIFSNNKIKYDVSVIITTYNNKNVLEKCLDSIYKYTKDINFEIIVVDNHSQDGTIFLVEKKYPTIKYIYLEDNYGFAKANNIGIMESCSKYILLLNNDTLLFNNLIKDLHDFMEKDQNNSACGPRLVDEKLRFQKQGSILFNLYLRIINKAVNVNFLPMTAFFIRKSVFDKIGLLDENFFFYNEDLDFALRMKKSDLVIRYIPSASLIHTGKGTAKYLPEKVIFESYKGGLYFVKKHYNRLIYIIYSIFVLFEINIKILYKKLEFKKNNREITELRKAKKLIFN